MFLLHVAESDWNTGWTLEKYSYKCNNPNKTKASAEIISYRIFSGFQLRSHVNLEQKSNI
jgi:hypothetical protein